MGVCYSLFVCVCLNLRCYVRASGGERVSAFRGGGACVRCGRACPCAPLCTQASVCEGVCVCVCVRKGGNGGGRGVEGSSQTEEAVDFTQHEDQSHSKPKGD